MSAFAAVASASVAKGCDLPGRRSKPCHRVVIAEPLVAVAASLSRQRRRAQLKKLGKGEGAVDIVAWPGYIERGETDKAL